MISKKLSPLRRRWTRLSVLECFDKWSYIAGRHRIKQMLVNIEVEHHLQALAEFSKILQIILRQYVGFAENDCAALPPRQKFREGPQHVIALGWSNQVRPLVRNHEWHGIHAKTIDSQLQPKSHNLQDFCLHLRMRRVQVRLKIIKAVKVIGSRNLIPSPCRLLHSWKHHS